LNRLHGKIALVTGGSRGIGAAIARRLGSEGAAVAITFLQDEVSAARVADSLEECLAIQADSAVPEELEDAVARTVDRFGALDIVVNNAGVVLEAPLDSISVENFDGLWAVNTRALFVLVKAAIPHMRPGGRIVAIGSTHAERVPNAGGAIYASTKSGLAGLVRGLARDLGPLGITINNVQPGPIATGNSLMRGPNGPFVKRLLAIPREGQPEEVASMVAYLVGPEAAFVTGASFSVDGGFSA
jgi:3-oxoacyl-[acyl-carrier protein] reductase